MASPDRPSLSPDFSELRARARQAYAWGRLRWTVGQLLPLGLIVAVGASFGDAMMTLGFAVALVVVSGALIFVGRGLERAVRAGWLAGAVPMLVAFSTASRFGCANAECNAICAWLCLGAGALVGAWLGMTLPGRQHWSTAAASLVVASLTATMGCAALGLGTALGALGGLSLGLAPIWAYRRAFGA